jgi:hypothetical protein
VVRGYADYTLNTWFPLDATVCTFKEEFIGGKLVDGLLGECAWSVYGTGPFPELAQPTIVWPHIGVVSVGGDQAANCFLAIGLDQWNAFGFIGQNTGWDSIFVFKIADDVSNVRVRVGWAPKTLSSPQPSAGAWIRFDKDAAFADANFQFCVREDPAHAEHVYDTGVPGDTNWHTLRIRSLETGVVLMSLDYAAEISFGAVGCDVTTDLSVVYGNPAFICGTTNTFPARLQADYCAFQAIGLGR